MPLIEELPVTNPTRVTHGWAYVPDVTHPIQSMTQPNSRKRNRNDAGTTNATATAKQQKANQQRLESLGRENWKDGVSVPIPPRQQGQGEKERKTKMTSNVRRILNYQKGFMHYLADEEAAAAIAGNNAGYGGGGSTNANTTTTTSTSSSMVYPISTTTGMGSSGKIDGRRKSSAVYTATLTNLGTTTTTVKTGPGRRRRSSNIEKESKKNGDVGGGDMAPPPKPAETIKLEDKPSVSTNPSAVPQSPPPKPKPPYDPSYDTNPLLRTLNLPKKPSERVMQILLSEPALSYTSARAKPLPDVFDEEDNNNKSTRLTITSQNKADSLMNKGRVTSKLKSKPPRHFCATCGYFGKVKCRKCGEWTCGVMECWTDHEGVCVALGIY